MALQNLLLQKLVNRELVLLIAAHWQVGRQADKHGAAEPHSWIVHELVPLIAVYWQVGRQADKHGAAEPPASETRESWASPFNCCVLAGWQTGRQAWRCRTFWSSRSSYSASAIPHPLRQAWYTDKKKNLIFLLYEEIQNGAVAKSYMTNSLLIYGEIFAHCLIYILGSPSPYMTLQLLQSEFPYTCMRKIWFSFLSVYRS